MTSMSLTNLPTEVLQNVLSFFDQVAQLRACRLTCHKLNDVSHAVSVYRNCYENMYDSSTASKTSATYPYEEEMIQRAALRANSSTLDLRKLLSIQTMLFEMESSTTVLGKNVMRLQDAQVSRWLYGRTQDVSRSSAAVPGEAMFHKVVFILLCSLLGPLSQWEMNYAKDVYPPADEWRDTGIVLFTYEDLFSTTVSRTPASGGQFASIVCHTAPKEFAGAAHRSTPNWQVFLAILKFMIHITNAAHERVILRDYTARPQATLHHETTHSDDLGMMRWTGVYVYLDFDAFHWVVSELADFSLDSLYSDGLQTCDFELHEDGTCSGSGRGAWRRTYGGQYTLKGTWTRVSGCPAGYKRVTFHKVYPHEPVRSHWLYDGLIVPGSNGGIFLGRWRDDTEMQDGEVVVTGPFIFWPS